MNKNNQKITSTIKSSNCRRYQARMVYSTLLHSFRNSVLSEPCSATKNVEVFFRILMSVAKIESVTN